MLKTLFISIILISSAFAGPREDALAYLNSIQNVDNLSARLDLLSQKFLGLPYGVGGPLGEGQSGRYDQDPLYRFDRFDCTTYLETIISLARAMDVQDFEQKMNEIRYENGEVDFLKRDHFTDLQWIPLNIENGILTEINGRIVSTNQILIAEAQIDFGNWLRHIKLDQIRVPNATANDRNQLLLELQSNAPYYPIQTARVNYISIATLLRNPALIERIPHASIVNFVRPNWDLTSTLGTHQNISHQAFIFRKGSVIMLRHASPTSGAVVELPFIEYIKKFENHPTLKGVQFMQVNL